MAFEGDVRHVLSALTVPSLVLHRTGDSFVVPEHSRYLAEHPDQRSDRAAVRGGGAPLQRCQLTLRQALMPSCSKKLWLSQKDEARHHCLRVPVRPGPFVPLHDLAHRHWFSLIVFVTNVRKESFVGHPTRHP